MKRQVPDTELIGCYKIVQEKDGAQSILLNVSNGVVKVWPDGEITLDKHDEEHRFTGRMVARYDEQAVAPLFHEVLNHQQPDEADREMLQLFCGNILWPTPYFEVALVMFGPGGTGKSTIAEAIAGTLADGSDRGDLVTSLSMMQLCDSRSYSLFKLRWAALNLTTEVDTVDLDESTHFKLIVSGEKMEVRPIYGKPISMRTSCKLMAVANSVPRFKNGSSAELRRLRFLVFDVPVAKPDTTLKERLATERDGIFLWMLEGLVKLQRAREVPLGGSKAQLIREKFAMSNDPVGYFVKSRCVVARDVAISRERLKNAFDEFLEQNGLPKQVEEWFFRRLYQQHSSEIRSQRINVTAMGGDREYQLTGICLADAG